ncbi:hypothetical protein Tco_0019739 [Tanacetum coccineum]
MMSQEMRKILLKQEFLEFRVSESEGLHKGYDRFQKILSQLNQMQAKPDNEDCNMKFLRALPPSWYTVASSLSQISQGWSDDLALLIDHKGEDEEKGVAQVYGMIAGNDDDAAGDASGDVFDTAAKFALMGKFMLLPNKPDLLLHSDKSSESETTGFASCVSSCPRLLDRKLSFTIDDPIFLFKENVKTPRIFRPLTSDNKPVFSTFYEAWCYKPTVTWMREDGELLLRPQQDHPHKNKDLGIIDSGCSRSMTGNNVRNWMTLLDLGWKIIGGTIILEVDDA